MKKVSIVIPTSNNEDTIENTIKSCMNQDYKNIEIIVVVNNSSDNTLEKVMSLSKGDSRIRLIKSPVGGRSISRNIGLLASSGDYINFLDADDKISINKIKESVEFLEQNNSYFAVAHSIKYVNIGEKELKITRASTYKIQKLLYRNIFPINAITFRNKNITPFRDNLEYNEDWLFWVENLYEKKIFFNNSVGGQVTITGKNTMNNKKVMLEYFVYVRSIINIEFKANALHSFKSNCSLLFRYFVMKDRNYDIQSKIKKNMLIEFKIVKLLMSFSVIRGIYKKKLTNEWNSKLY